MALLFEPAPADARGRDEAATRALRHATSDDDLTVSRRDSGRPRLSPPYCELGVSMSTCRAALLLGFHPERPVGVDIEAESAIDADEVDRLASDHFTSHEAAAIATAPRMDKRAMFLCLWTAKEAVLKVTGRGVYDGLGWPVIDIAVPPPGLGPAYVVIPASAHAGRLLIAVRRIGLATAGTAWAALCVVA